jgi:hypothetical protein
LRRLLLCYLDLINLPARWIMQPVGRGAILAILDTLAKASSCFAMLRRASPCFTVLRRASPCFARLRQASPGSPYLSRPPYAKTHQPVRIHIFDGLEYLNLDLPYAASLVCSLCCACASSSLSWTVKRRSHSCSSGPSSRSARARRNCCEALARGTGRTRCCGSLAATAPTTPQGGE